MLSNEANLLWLSSVSLLHTNSSQVEALRVIFFFFKEEHQGIFQNSSLHIFFLVPIGIPIFLSNKW